MTYNEPIAFAEYQEALRTLRVWESVICDDALAGRLPTEENRRGHWWAKDDYERQLARLVAGGPAVSEIRHEA